MVRKILLIIIVLVIGIGVAGAKPIRQTGDKFTQFLTEFKAAVAKDDKEKLYTMVSPDKFLWEGLNKGFIDSKDKFMKNYPSMFTKAIKEKITSGKLVKFQGGNYSIEWTEKEVDYSLDFIPEKDGSYKFYGLSVTPP